MRLAYPTGITGSALGFPNWAPGPRDGRGSYPTNWIVLRLITHQKPPALVKNGGTANEDERRPKKKRKNKKSRHWRQREKSKNKAKAPPQQES